MNDSCKLSRDFDPANVGNKLYMRGYKLALKTSWYDIPDTWNKYQIADYESGFIAGRLFRNPNLKKTT